MRVASAVGGPTGVGCLGSWPVGLLLRGVPDKRGLPKAQESDFWRVLNPTFDVRNVTQGHRPLAGGGGGFAPFNFASRTFKGYGIPWRPRLHCRKTVSCTLCTSMCFSETNVRTNLWGPHPNACPGGGDTHPGGGGRLYREEHLEGSAQPPSPPPGGPKFLPRLPNSYQDDLNFHQDDPMMEDKNLCGHCCQIVVCARLWSATMSHTTKSIPTKKG